MILLSVSLYSQYPQKRIIKGDSVVIITVKQADTINNLYLSYNETIKTKKQGYDSAINQLGIKEDSLSNLRFYFKNIKSGATTEEIEEFREEFRRTQSLNRLWLFFLFMAFSIVAVQNQ